MGRLIIALILASAAVSPARAADASAALSEAMTIAKTALTKGYGNYCDLAAMPAITQAKRYYRCIDLGPYRVVAEYGRTSVFLVAGGEPFRFMEDADGHTVLLVAGPWEKDLPARAIKFRDDISGTSAERERAAIPDRQRTEAEQRLLDYQNKDKAVPAKEQDK